MSDSKTNPSLQKKTAARMAAAQALYTLAVTGEKRTPAQLVAKLRKQLENNKDEQKLLVGMALEPNYNLVESLLSGVNELQGDIDQFIDNSLTGAWKRERLSPLLVAIMQCGIYELCFGKDIKARIVIDEYTRLTRHFFADAEVNFVHGALNKIAAGASLL